MERTYAERSEYDRRASPDDDAAERVSAHVRYDTTDASNPGWYAEYRRGGNVIGDSEKVGHPDMPRHVGSGPKAGMLARNYARTLRRDTSIPVRVYLSGILV